ncbi:MAG: LacI family DNA-binding transcriptional regulator [Lachnospiraceae bacterium]|nr:LacI family DNA-binding transcriptional regulator [Lachnospiraceae bacterium]
MATRVTLQDVADALSLSRNTVSKAINNTGVLSESTREKVLKKAIEMGYKQFSYANSISDIQNPPVNVESGEIALFTGGFLGNSHFATTMLDKFQHEISTMGYSLTLYHVDKSNIADLSLPVSFRKENTRGIICIEMFDQGYCEMICALGLPVLMVDAPVSTYWSILDADILLMENNENIFSMIRDAKKRGITKIGFIGEATHCRSFFERYMAFRNAMFINDLEIDPAFCLTEVHPHDPSYREYLYMALSKLKKMPELFICANDFVAIDVLEGFKKLGIRCPEDVKLFGFDDSPESKVMTPSLSTCHIHSQAMGYSAANILLSRIKQPDLNYRITYTETDIILRESTK